MFIVVIIISTRVITNTAAHQHRDLRRINMLAILFQFISFSPYRYISPYFHGVFIAGKRGSFAIQFFIPGNIVPGLAGSNCKTSDAYQ